MLLLKDKKVLIAEDDMLTREQMSEILGMIFGKVVAAKDGEEAYWLYEEEMPDIIISDIQMPKKDGLKLVKMIRLKDYNTPIVMVTSFTEQHMLLEAANLSVDGYLIKPVGLAKMIETISKAMNRVHRGSGFVELGPNLLYNSDTKELYQNRTLVQLGHKEHELLEVFIKRPTKTVTKEEIAAELWPFDPACDSAVKNLVLRIRKKLGEEFIISVRGVGYRLGTTPHFNAE